ncbi:MAG: hypothetical protein JRF02_04985 [Deltaproteobacteria bacterium]|jgi:hypothetical protein|nr:hypothetical protein [Deltaproteobacteria bacterium]
MSDHLQSRTFAARLSILVLTVFFIVVTILQIGARKDNLAATIKEKT